jgi:hypothetical protein
LCSGSLVAYLGALRSGHAVCLVDANLQRDLLGRFIDQYTPEWIFAEEEIDVPGYSERVVAGGDR